MDWTKARARRSIDLPVEPVEPTRAGRARPVLPDEAEVVERLLAGDEEAFAETVRRLSGGLLRLALVFVRSRAVAEEVVQDTWLAVVDGLDGFERRSPLKAWIFGILANRAKTRGVREGRSVPFSALSPGEDDGPGEERFGPDGAWAQPPVEWGAETPEHLLLRRETLRVLEEALAGLPPAQRAVVTLRDVEGFSSVEACNVLGLAETHQRVLLHRARTKVRRALEKHLESGDACRPAAR